MLSKRLDQLQRTLSIDAKVCQSGIPRGFFIKSFYQSRFIARFPRLFPSHNVEIKFSDPMAGKCTADALIRVDGGGGDLSIIAGLLGDREYWDQKLLPVKRLLDLGANIGLASLWFSVVSPGVQIACVEPDPRNIKLLKANLIRNNLQASVFACAVDASSGQFEFGLNSHTGCSSLTSAGLHQHYQTVFVQVRTVSQILDELGWDTVDVIKMDVEGAEHTILKSCSEWIERVGRIVLEIHPTTTPEAIAGMMNPFGFVLRRIGYGIEPTFILERAEK